MRKLPRSGFRYKIAVQNKEFRDPEQGDIEHKQNYKQLPILLDKEETRVAVAVSPSYSCIEPGKFVLNEPEHKNTFTSEQLLAFAQIPVDQLLFFIGIGDTWTHRAIVNCVTTTEQKTMKPLKEVLKEAKRISALEETKWVAINQTVFDEILENREKKYGDFTPVLLTSEIAKRPDFKKLFQKISALHGKQTSEDSDEQEFINLIKKSAGLALKRLFKEFLKPKLELFCNVVNEQNESYKPREFMTLMMEYHLLSEMTFFALIGSALQIKYVLHPKTQNPHENAAMNQLLRTTMALFTEDGSDFMKWLSYTLKPEKIPKTISFDPPTKSSPMDIKVTPPPPRYLDTAPNSARSTGSSLSSSPESPGPKTPPPSPKRPTEELDQKPVDEGQKPQKKKKKKKKKKESTRVLDEFMKVMVSVGSSDLPPLDRQEMLEFIHSKATKRVSQEVPLKQRSSSADNRYRITKSETTSRCSAPDTSITTQAQKRPPTR
jgi:hypothetical protein